MVKTIKIHKLRTAAALCLPLALALTWASPAAAAPAPSPSPATTKAPAPTASAAAATPKPTATAVTSAAPIKATAPASTPATAAAPATATPSARAQAAITPVSAPEQGQARMGRAGLNPASTSAAMATTQQVPVAQATEPWVAEQPFATRGQPLGLDVSGWQGTVNWSSVRANGARFAYVKATEGTTFRNSEFGAQYTGARSVGLLRGAYHFGRPDVSDGAAQARFFVNNGGGWSPDGVTMPPVLDIEDNPYAGLNRCYGATPGQLATWVRDFTRTVYRMTNKQAMIYTSYYFWRDCLGNTSEFSKVNPLWLASYYTNGPSVPGGWPTYTVWQYANAFADASQTVRATFPGDQNVFNGSMDQLRKLASTPDTYPIGLIPGATLLSGKWAGDGKSYTGWFKDGYWCLQMPSAPRRCFGYGSPGDKPVVGDWNGNGRAGIGIFRNGMWWLVDDINTRAITKVVGFGVGSDTPIVGDWNGSGRDGIGIWRNSSFQVSYNISNPVVNEYSGFGIPSDTPIVGDWDGDGRTSIGVWRKGEWWLSNRIKSPVVSNFIAFGIGTDRPITGDWNGDRLTTVGIVRGNNWQLTNSLAKRTVDISYF
ncbi:GH25 family lysozyme [Arthrobacter sp. LAR12-1-1.1]|uniref:GH25 family lysozyme n=1 Tax=Arthrobacter sp. LAR12-1-1.1 TaxID=3135215 RepID=UPI0034317523